VRGERRAGGELRIRRLVGRADAAGRWRTRVAAEAGGLRIRVRVWRSGLGKLPWSLDLEG
jgi:hypothetical protein